MKNVLKLTLSGLLVATLSACGSTDFSCDEVQYYQLAEESKRVEAPEGLDDLDPLEEMVLPEAAPREERAVGSDCFDRPPSIELQS